MTIRCMSNFRKIVLSAAGFSRVFVAAMANRSSTLKYMNIRSWHQWVSLLRSESSIGIGVSPITVESFLSSHPFSPSSKNFLIDFIHLKHSVIKPKVIKIYSYVSGNIQTWIKEISIHQKWNWIKRDKSVSKLNIDINWELFDSFLWNLSYVHRPYQLSYAKWMICVQ